MNDVCGDGGDGDGHDDDDVAKDGMGDLYDNDDDDEDRVNTKVATVMQRMFC